MTSSPLAPRATATSASPRTFHYATATSASAAATAASAATHSTRSPRQSPRSPHSPRIIAPLARRHSKHSYSRPSPSESRSPSSSQARSSKQYVAVDAATQYSPMEPFDPTVPLRAASPSQAGPRRSHHPADTTTATVTAPPPALAEPPPPEPNISPDNPEVPRTNPLSPGKRRKSHDLTAARPSSSSVVASIQPSSPKRSKPNQGPPKVLPLRYELCDVEDMVVLISNMLSELIETNDSIALKSGQLTRFHSRYVRR